MQQPVQVVAGQPYGERKRLEEAQKVIPLPTSGGGPAAPMSPAQSAAPGPPPPQLDFARPTERPNEPVTTGLPIGPGAGPSALAQPATDQVGTTLRGLYAQNPSNDILRLIELHDHGF